MWACRSLESSQRDVTWPRKTAETIAGCESSPTTGRASIVAHGNDVVGLYYVGFVEKPLNST